MGRVHRWSCCYYGEFGGIENLSLTATEDEVTLYGGKVASDLQTNLTIEGKTISGTLKFIEGGLAEEGYLAGDGYFMAVTWSEPEEGITSVKVGLEPSLESGLVEGIDDPDRTLVAKVTPAMNQKAVFVQSDGNNSRTQYFNLNLEFEDPESEG